MKPKRREDPVLLEAIRTLPCMGCGRKPIDGCHAHHVITRKAGGPDHHRNVVSLCARDHSLIHQLGIARFAEKYPLFRSWLENAGWKLNFNALRWERPDWD